MSGSSVRGVGGCRVNAVPLFVLCHRVVVACGLGRFMGVRDYRDVKARLLRLGGAFSGRFRACFFSIFFWEDVLCGFLAGVWGEEGRVFVPVSVLVAACGRRLGWLGRLVAIRGGRVGRGLWSVS